MIRPGVDERHPTRVSLEQLIQVGERCSRERRRRRERARERERARARESVYLINIELGFTQIVLTAVLLHISRFSIFNLQMI